MKRLEFGTLLLFLLISTKVFSQKLPDDYFLFFNAKDQETCVIYKDSMLYRNSMDTQPIFINKNTQEKLSFYKYNFIIDSVNYFVSDGAGCVLEFQNNHINRLDHSYPHKNQYVASPFVYQNEIYLFGGYGLFTFKNILTKYDFNLKEWFEIPIQSIEKPSERYKSNSILIKDKLYVVGGVGKEKTGIDKVNLLKTDLWELDLKTMKWKTLGKINLKYINQSLNQDNVYNFQFTRGNKLCIIDRTHAAIIDIPSNTISYYRFPISLNIEEQLVYNSKTDEISYLAYNAGEKRMVLKTVPFESIFSKPFAVEKFYSQNSISSHKEYWIFGLLLLGFITSIAALLFRKKKKQKQKIAISNKNVIYYNQIQDQLTHNKTIINDLEGLEKQVFLHLFNNIHQYIPIVELNDIIEKNMGTSNLNTILRNRDTILKLLQFKFSRILDEDDLFLQQKNAQDKRIKEIKLNEKYFQIQNEVD